MKEKGYNLVEVIIAVALLAWVLLVIAGMFIYGQHGVQSGNLQTKAVALDQMVLEDLQQAGAEAYTLLTGLDVSAGSSSVTYSPYVGTLTQTELDSATPETRWQYALKAFPGKQGDVTLTVQVEGLPAGTAISSASVVRYTVTVTWKERLRKRQVVLTTLL